MLNNKSSGISNKSQNEKGLEETRRSNMISWQIGSEASKMLASSPSKWGKGAKYPAFDVWQDVKFFYQSYINKKYNNIISYLNRFSKYDVLKIVADVLEKKADPANINLSDVDELNATLGMELQEETSKYNSNATNSRAQNNPVIKSLLAKKTALMKELEVVSSQLKEDLDTLTDLREQVQTAAGEEMKAAATYVEPYPSDINDGITGSGKIAKIQSVSDQMDSFVSKSAENEEKLGIKEQENKVEEGKNKQANLEKKLSDLEEEISSMTLDIQESDDDLILQLTAKKTGLKDVVANILSKRQNDDKDIKKRINALVDKEIKKLKKDGMIIIGGTNEYLKLVNKANQQLSNAINQMTAIVNTAKANILALGDGLYDPANHQKVVDIHQNMINSIKAISITIDGGVLPPVRGIMLFSSLLNTDTSAEEDDYFVGNPVKKRDIKAPKMVFKESNPPLREVFYFDLTDFMNVKPFSKRSKRSSKINVQDFLSSGAEIPTVWKYLLHNPVFVEEDLDLRELFNGNCQDISFYRHGSMPCQVRGSSQIA
ncbi:MAG: hypothetical protein IKL33_00035, partial [Alphaproteobacteria bacterium]|nr:hypothetical protein [Alphaproteobacteria bacterium]